MTMNSPDILHANTHAITLPVEQWQWLDQITIKYKLPNLSTTICACIDCVIIGDVAMPAAKVTVDPNTVTVKTVDLSLEQIAFLTRHDNADMGEDGIGIMACQVVQACKSSYEWLVFGNVKNKQLNNNLERQHEDLGGMSQDDVRTTRDLGDQEPVVVGESSNSGAGNNNIMTASTTKQKYNQVPLILTQEQWEWLEQMASKHKLPSMAKAVRCCINCVALEDANNNAPTTSQELDDQSTTNKNEEGITKPVELSKQQLAWLESKRKECGSHGVSRRMMQSCMAMDEYTVFGIIRCKSSIAKCAGAKEAMQNIGQEYGQKEDDVVVMENIDIVSKSCGCDSNKCKSEPKGKKKNKGAYQQIPIILKQQQWEWLENMTSMHKLPSMSKAVRCCINCVALGDADGLSTTTTQKDVDRSVTQHDNNVRKEVELSEEQIDWLESKHLDKDGAERVEFFSKQIATCMRMEENTVFGMIRCKSSIAKCEGAQEAMQNIGE